MPWTCWIEESTRGRMTRCVSAWRRATRSTGHPRWSSTALIISGVLHAREGRLEATKKASLTAISLDVDETTTANAWFDPGAALQREQRFDAAIAAFQHAAGSPDTTYAAMAGVNLGYPLFHARGDVDAARAAFQAVIAHDVPEQTELAELNLRAIGLLDASDTSVVDEHVNLASGFDRSTDERSIRRRRFFGK